MIFSIYTKFMIGSWFLVMAICVLCVSVSLRELLFSGFPTGSLRSLREKFLKLGIVM